MGKYLSATLNFGPPGGFSGPGTGPLSQTTSPGTTLNNVVSTIVGALTTVAAIYFVFMFFIGAIQWIGAGNDQKKIESARGKITTGIVGLIIAIAAIFIIDILGNIVGIDILDPATMLNL